MSDMGRRDMDCREARQALGVYVVAAIEPADRALVEAHLGSCLRCREELAGLAGLPALLGRVPRAEADLLAPAGLQAADEPPPELLRSVLAQVAARRKVRRWRGITAAAAAVIIAVGGGVAIAHALGPRAAAPSPDVASASDARTHISAVVDYSASGPGTAMRVRVSGIPVGTTCQFWVVSATGQRSVAGRWTITRSYGAPHWYPVTSALASSAVHGFEITSRAGLLLDIPAT